MQFFNVIFISFGDAVTAVCYRPTSAPFSYASCQPGSTFQLRGIPSVSGAMLYSLSHRPILQEAQPRDCSLIDCIAIEVLEVFQDHSTWHRSIDRIRVPIGFP